MSRLGDLNHCSTCSATASIHRFNNQPINARVSEVMREDQGGVVQETAVGPDSDRSRSSGRGY
jgi:hypothetical protein